MLLCGNSFEMKCWDRWNDLESRSGLDRLEHYKHMLVHLGSHGSLLIEQIFANAGSIIKKPATLGTLVTEIDTLDWYNAKREGLGDLYEGLLEKNANEKKSGAGQYFTPRPLIDRQYGCRHEAHVSGRCPRSRCRHRGLSDCSK